MLRSLYVAATGMDAQQLKMDVIADNLANASTTGFKKSRADFDDLIADQMRAPTAPDPSGTSQVAPLEVGLGVRTGATSRSMSQGDLYNTGNPLDLAIQGTGFLKVQRPNGEEGFTRAGNLRVDSTGRLVTQQGQAIEPAINVPADTTSITISAEGKVTATVPGRPTPAELGTLELATFTNPGGLERLGNNLLGATPSSGEAVLVKPGEQGTGTLAQGFLESSNVKAVEEMIEMIAAQRGFEMNSKVVQTADQMLQRLTSLR
jgi:flagellar basal-body rod protein FlgG